jgi:hypothetical protein
MITPQQNPYYHIIFSVSEIDKINWQEVQENSYEELRLSLDGSKTFVKWTGETPYCILTLSNSDGPYNYQEFSQILNTNEWKSN